VNARVANHEHRIANASSQPVCLDIVDYAGPITAGDLAKQSGLTTGAVTAVLDRLERKGYVRRTRDTADRRRVLIEMTDEARQRAMEFYGPLAEAGMKTMEEFTLAQLAGCATSCGRAARSRKHSSSGCGPARASDAPGGRSTRRGGRGSPGCARRRSRAPSSRR
jgi:DNA-binding MarR family transcriptional regulator